MMWMKLFLPPKGTRKWVFDEYASGRKSQNGKKIGEYLLENIEEIAPLLSMEAGKTLLRQNLRLQMLLDTSSIMAIRQKHSKVALFSWVNIL